MYDSLGTMDGAISLLDWVSRLSRGAVCGVTLALVGSFPFNSGQSFEYTIESWKADPIFFLYCAGCLMPGSCLYRGDGKWGSINHALSKFTVRAALPSLSY